MNFESTVDAPLPEWTRRDAWAFRFYQIGGYLLLNLIDEPAWLALMFC
jgi:hypothetical protein